MSALSVREQGTTLGIVAGGVEIARYVAEPSTPAVESTKPYLHPLRTLDGAVVSAFRPWDHPWHKGLQFTASELSDENFWGGKTYVDGEYLWLDNVGRMQHDGYSDITIVDDSVTVAERLTWITAAGESWIDEDRSLRFHGVDDAAGLWLLDFSTRLRNARSAPISFGSPTTRGRENAGYTGLFWRGPRSWTGGDILADGGVVGESAMGTSSRWLALSGRHDEIDGGATVLFVAGTSSSAVPVTWFVRSEPFAAINTSFAFHDTSTLEPGETLVLRHRVAVIGSILPAQRLSALADDLAAGFAAEIDKQENRDVSAW